MPRAGQTPPQTRLSAALLAALAWLCLATRGSGNAHQQRVDRGDAATGHVVLQAASSRASLAIARRCRYAVGDWCVRFGHQRPVPLTVAAPRGDKTCPRGCSGNGNCNHGSGLCECPAGWQGEDCGTPQLRPCTNGFRTSGSKPLGHIDAAGRDLDLMADGWSPSRCAGLCDATIGACYCDGKYRHVPAPRGSPYGAPPLQYGRILSDQCKPSTAHDGRNITWGVRSLSWAALFGPHGACEGDGRPHNCGTCILDGRGGSNCDQPYEAFCINQCTGHGECVLGFCKCHEGWYGFDCSRKKAGLPMEPGLHETSRPWLRPLVRVPLEVQAEAYAHVRQRTQGQEAQRLQPGEGGPGQQGQQGQPLPVLQRKRPLIYIYDMPPQYTSRMHQYRIIKEQCMWRMFHENNKTRSMATNLYALEPYFLETLAQSNHRTFDPEQADLFYVPMFLACYFKPVFGWADHPWWHGPLELRPLQGANMLLEAKRWLQRTYPFWDRHGGRDHVWLAIQDEGACWFPSEIYNTSIILTHWGRLDHDHQSNTAYKWDNYSQSLTHAEWQPQDWRLLWQGHPCYTPGKDLVVPSWKHPWQYEGSLLAGGPAVERDLLLFFSGDVGKAKKKHYSRGIRQELYRLAKEHGWRKQHNISINDPDDTQRSHYTQLLARSIFCLAAPGDGWSSRVEDAVLHGCIPLIVMDDVHAVFESILMFEDFALRINQNSLRHVPDLLRSIPNERITAMQRKIKRVWHRFAYTSGPAARAAYDKALAENVRRANRRARLSSPSPAPPRPPTTANITLPKIFPHVDDAFSTIMQWLYSRSRAYGNDLAQVPHGS